MKINIYTFIICSIILSLGLMSNSSGRGAVAGEQRTGAPGENSTTCLQCHDSGNFGTTVELTLSDLDGNQVTEYIPNESYNLNLSIGATTGSPAGWGFQLVALTDTEDPVNTWGDNVPSELRVIDLGGRDYVEQTQRLSSPDWSIPWTAPEGNESVTFYACGNNVNGNGGTSGDLAAVTNLTISEAISSSTSDIDPTNIFASPNPVSQMLYINQADQIDRLMVFDTNGRMVISSTQPNNQIDFGNIDSGMYIIVYMDQNGRRLKSEKLIKI